MPVREYFTEFLRHQYKTKGHGFVLFIDVKENNNGDCAFPGR